MSTELVQRLLEDHASNQGKLQACVRADGTVDLERFNEFRHGLLRHIAIEETLVMPALARILGAEPVMRKAQRREHAGIAALCVPTPSLEWIEDLRELLAHHQRVEEAPDSLHDLVAQHLADDEALLEAVKSFPRLTLPDFAHGPRVKALLQQVMVLVGLSAPRPDAGGTDVRE